MGVLSFWSSTSSKSETTGDKKQDSATAQEQPKPSAELESTLAKTEIATLAVSVSAKDVALPDSPPQVAPDTPSQPTLSELVATSSSAPTSAASAAPAASTPATTAFPSSVAPTPELAHDSQKAKSNSLDNRRFSFRGLALFGGRVDHKQQLSTIDERLKKDRAAEAYTKYSVKQSSSDRRAKESALVVRSLIVGPSSITPSSAMVKAVTKPQVKKVKAQLLEPKSANKVIAQLRQLPLAEGPLANGPSKSEPRIKSHGPIHAVCLPCTDIEAQERHFSRLSKDTTVEPNMPSVAAGTIEIVTATFNDLHLVNLLTKGGMDMGISSTIGSPTEGILSGALPSAEAVIDGITQITPQLMNLGFATGKAVVPDHTGVYPPTDRISVITYWWGLELVLPEASMHNLSNVPSISHSVLNFLSALALLNNGVAEILPFIRYISSYVDFEWSSIQKQDRGEGVVCAATWIMPAAMVPRPWDFPPPPKEEQPIKESPPVDEAPVAVPKSGSKLKPEIPSTPAKENGTTAPAPGTPPPKSEEPTEIPTLPPTLPSFKVTPPTLSKKTGESEGSVTPPQELSEEPAVQVVSVAA
ncbi:hypothetical protein NEOLEDRAFT_1177422 [Neolentinus lepideus HHB14362 ss-1]|uniref:Uncharacterized protein n=1 Tax=Neolentinus lepideus HHB14362 ss-1 TaxID=1314782 RepID=A0A165TLB9_9AGAM|nr:hypothetical protein NEOLEDRAFT_1177422 [Neolentinus lepideus HHB14362 ss-1]